MARLIDRDALLKACEESQKSDPQADNRGWSDHFLNSAGEPSAEWWAIEDMIESQPIINAAPMVHGRWMEIETEDAYDFAGIKTWALKARCSECDFVMKFIEAHTGQYIYCPNCGAKMDAPTCGPDYCEIGGTTNG